MKQTTGATFVADSHRFPLGHLLLEFGVICAEDARGRSEVFVVLAAITRAANGTLWRERASDGAVMSRSASVLLLRVLLQDGGRREVGEVDRISA